MQLAATFAEVQNVAVAVNALKFNSDRARYDSASRGLKHDGSDMQEIDDYDSKWCAVMDAARVPALGCYSWKMICVMLLWHLEGDYFRTSL